MGEPLPLPRYSSREEELLRGFRTERLAAVPVSLLYRLLLAGVAGLMLLLPLAYLALLAASVWGAWWYVLHIYPYVKEVPGLFLKVAVGALPPLALLILAFFMVKSLFPQAAETSRPRVLQRNDEPILYAFVERLCRTLRAPVPREIHVDLQVNASASFRRGLWSLPQRDLVLTLGLPLVAGMSLEQATGVLAHELGHFSQRAGMSVSYLIRSVNGWFARVGYGSDSVDDWLKELREGRHWLGVLLAWLGMAFLWLSRRLLRGLMWIGHGFSSFLMRQMELDADRYEARLVGSRTFESTMTRLAGLSVAQQHAFADLSQLWREGRLTDSLPGLVMIHHGQLAAKIEPALQQEMGTSETGFFDTHPASRERIANARREPEEGVFQSPFPAAALFRDFPALARSVSRSFFREVLGSEFREDKLLPTTALAEQKERTLDEERAAARYFQGAVGGNRPLPLAPGFPEAPAPSEVPALRAELLAARQEMERRLPEVTQENRLFGSAREHLIAARTAEELLAAGCSLDPAAYRLPRAEIAAAKTQQEKALQRLADLAGSLAPFDRAAGLRLQAALGLLAAAGIEAGRTPRVYASFVQLESQLEALHDLHSLHAAASALWKHLEAKRKDSSYLERMVELHRRIHGRLAGISEALSTADYPFDHDKGGLTLAGFAIPEVPEAIDVTTLYQAAGLALQHLFGLHRRLLSHLAAAAERAEAALGMPPLPEPPRS